MSYTLLYGSYTHNQSTPNTTWTIVHNLNIAYPAVDCWIQDGSSIVKIIPESVQIVDNQTVVVTFSTARAGTACVV